MLDPLWFKDTLLSTKFEMTLMRQIVRSNRPV